MKQRITSGISETQGESTIDLNNEEILLLLLLKIEDACKMICSCWCWIILQCALQFWHQFGTKLKDWD
jgi:hypothetical protein